MVIEDTMHHYIPLKTITWANSIVNKNEMVQRQPIAGKMHQDKDEK